MTKDSLIKVRNKIILLLEMEENIDLLDKVELMMNLSKFLDPSEYEKNIMILRCRQ